MPFRHYLIWAYCLAGTDAWWSDGFSADERQKEYGEVNALARHLLTTYNNSGKSFYLGHWEGDWYLLPGYNTATNPSPTTIQGMVDWLNTRQLAVDDAMRDVPHTNVAVYNYTEVNRVRDAMINPATSNQRLVNAVLPNVTNLDFVSWSSYDGMNLATSTLYATLDYIEVHLPTNKAATLSGKRVWIGEYGWGGSNTSAEQEPLTRAYFRKLIPWGPRFILFWEMYDNEDKAYWLIDKTGAKTPCYLLHQRFANLARLQAARFKETHGRLPTDAEFAALVTPSLNQALPQPQRLTLSNQSLTTITNSTATVSATLEQGVYGEDAATVWLLWGPQDGGIIKSNWANSLQVGINTRFNPAIFTGQLTNLTSEGTEFFRFYATNNTGEAWATNSVRFTTGRLRAADFGSRMQIRWTGYTHAEALSNFPALVLLSTNIPGFSYEQFASPTGGDLRFADAGGTVPIAHEIDEWNTNGVSSVWVQVPSVATTNDSVWAYWGNPVATNPPVTSTNGTVWSNGFELVWHLKETALPHADSTLQHPAVSGVNPTPTLAGAIGHGGVFNGSSSHLDAGAIGLGDQFTLSVWTKVSPTADNIQTLWANKTGGSTSDGFALFINSWQTHDQKVLFETGNGTSGALAATPTNTLRSDTWHQVAATVDRSDGVARLYVDGTERGNTFAALADFGLQQPVTLGSFEGPQYCFTGVLDEARIETQVRSPDWIWASWITVASNAAFAACGPVIREPPALSASVQGNAVHLRWSTRAVGYQLFTTASLISPNWALVTNPPVLTSEYWQATLPPASNPERFYRLQAFP